MTTQNLEFTPKNFHLYTSHPLPCTSCIQYQQQYYAPQPFSARDKVKLLTPLPGRPDLLPVGSQGVINMIDSKGTPIIQFQSRILNCLPVDIPCLQKLPTASVWTITGLTPSSQPPFKLVAIASPKYRDTATQNPTTLTKEFNIQPGA